MIQDPKGYIWLSDQDNSCIIRYDGSRMNSYRYDLKIPNSLGGNYPECLFADSSGIIWIGFYGQGLDRFDPETTTFTHFRHSLKDPFSLNNDTVSSIIMDHEGVLWVGTYGGLDRLDPKTGKFMHYAHSGTDPASLSCNKVRAVYEDHEGALWIGTGIPFDNYMDGGLNRFDRKTEKFTRYLHDPDNDHSLINNKVRALFEDSRGTFWVGTAGSDGLHTMDRATGKFERHLYNPAKPEQLSRPFVKKGDKFDHITFITEDGRGAIWIGTFSQGLLRYEPQSKTMTHYNSDENKSTGFKDNSGWCAIISHDGVFWVSTQEKNLYRVDPFRNIIPHHDAPSINCFYEDPTSTLWYGTLAQGLFSKDLRTGITHQYKNDPKDIRSLSSNNVNAIVKDRKGDLWVGTYGGGVNRLIPGTQKFTRFQHDAKNSKSLISDEVITLFPDRESNLWIGTTGGCDELDSRTGNFIHYRNNPQDTNSISRNFITCFLEDRQHGFWIGTWSGGGLNKLNQRTGKFKHYLKDEYVSSMYEDSKGRVWVCTSSGLYRYNRISDKFSLFDEKSIGFNITIKWAVVGDSQDNLWFCSTIGIIKLIPDRYQMIIYGKKNGVNGNSLFFQAGYKGPKGDIYFGDRDGYFAIAPGKLHYNPVPPALSINSFWIADKQIQPAPNGPLQEPLSIAKEIRLLHNQNIFSFILTAIDYGNPEDNKIFYRLKNFDLNWIPAGSEGRAFYFNVPPGHYVFQVKAMNSNNGVWAEEAIAVTISPPFWKSRVAYCMYGLLFIASVFGIDRFQRRRLLRNEKERTRLLEMVQSKKIQEAYLELKTTQAQLIHQEKMASLGELTAGIAHEIQNPLNFVNNFSEVNAELIDEMKQELQAGNMDDAINVANDIKENNLKIAHHGQRADAIVKGMLLHSRSSTGQKQPVDINALTDEYLRLSYHGLRAKDKSFNVTIKTDFDSTLKKINIVPQDVGRVVLNLLTNAFYSVAQKQKLQIQGYEPTVAVKTKGINNHVEIRIRDNGMGISQLVLDKIFQPFFTTKPSGEGTGLGLSLSYDIITKMNGGKMTVETKEGEFAEFIIQLPVL